jgi:hypothetical protein
MTDFVPRENVIAHTVVVPEKIERGGQRMTELIITIPKDRRSPWRGLSGHNENYNMDML